MIDAHDGYTPTPVISHAILTYNKGRTQRPGRRHRDHAVAQSARGRRLQIQSAEWRTGRYRRHRLDRARRQRACSRTVCKGVKRIPYERAREASTACIATITSGPTSPISPTSSTWRRSAAPASSIGIDPLGGAGVHYWQPIIERYGLAATIVNDAVDPTFRFMTVDWDGKIRMDCSSPYAMARLIGMRDKFDVAFANDTDADRHGIVTRSSGLMNPNHYLAARDRLSVRAPAGMAPAQRGRQDHRQQRHHRPRRRQARPQSWSKTPVGFKWFVDGLIGGIVRLRRRGKRRRLVPAARRLGLDHRQGRHHPRPARRRDHGAHRRDPESAVRRADRRTRRAVLRADRRAGDSRAEEHR